MHPKPAKYVSQDRLAIMQWEEYWKTVMTRKKMHESALLEICPNDVKEQMIMRFNEIYKKL